MEISNKNSGISIIDSIIIIFEIKYKITGICDSVFNFGCIL